MQRIIMLMFFMAMCFIAFLIAAPLFIDHAKYEAKLLAYIKKSTGLEPVIEGGVEVKFFPTPLIVAKSVSIDNVKEASTSHVVHIESIQTKVAFTDIFVGDFQINEIEFVRPVFEFEKFSASKLDKKESSENLDKDLEPEEKVAAIENNWSMLIKAFKARELEGLGEFPDKVIIRNATFSYIKDLQKTSLDYFNAEITADSFEGPFYLVGGFSSSDKVVKFSGHVDSFTEGAKVGMSIESEAAKINLDGQYKDGENPTMEGNIDVKSNNIAHVIGLIFNNKTLVANITSKEELKVSGEFVFSKEKFMLKNILLDSESIKGGIDVAVDFHVGDDSKNVEWEFKGDIDKIDLDRLLAEEKSEKNVDERVLDYYAYSVSTTSLSDFRFDIPKSLTLLLDVAIDDIIYNEKISNVRAQMDIVGGQAEVNSFSADLPGNSRAILRGKIEHNGTRPLFDGTLEFGGSSFREFLTWLDKYYEFIPEETMKEFLLTSDLRVTPQQIDVTDVLFSFDKSLFSGEFSIRPLKTIPMINASINIDRMDLGTYGIDRQVFAQFANLTKDADNMIMERTWLNKLKNKINITVNANDVIFNSHYINNFSMSAIISRSLFNLQNFYINGEDVKLRADLNINSQNENVPKLTLNFFAKEFNTKFLRVDDEKKTKDLRWLKRRINMLGLGKFYGEYDITIKDLQHNKLEMSDITIKAKSNSEFQKEVVNLTEFKSNFYGGEVKLEGQLSLNTKSPSIAVNSYIEGVNINPVLKAIKEDSTVSGQVFFFGSLATSGRTVYDLVQKLKVRDGSNASLRIQKLKFKGFDLEKIITESRRQYSYIDMQEIIKKASVSGETEFDWLEGFVRFNDGVLQVSDFRLVNELSRGKLDANLSLISFDTQARAKMLYKPESNRVVSIPVSLRGNILELEKSIDTKDLEIYITDKASR